MAAPRSGNNDRMAWFKMDAGRFNTDTAGYSLRQSGAYSQLMNLYWIMGNCLPADESGIMRRVGAVVPEDIEVVREVMGEFFPLDAEGKHRHALLDQQLTDVQIKSAQASAAAKSKSSKPKQPPAPDADAEDF